MSLLAHLLRGAIVAYRWTLRPFLGPHCRFEPHCSDYGMAAIAAHGALRGAALTAWRVCRCNPWSAGGYDPVPAAKLRAEAASPPRA